MKRFLTIAILLCSYWSISAQGLIDEALNQNQANNSFPQVRCGTHEHMKHLDHQAPGYIKEADNLLKQVNTIVENSAAKTSANDVYTIPVVFHIVHNSAEENLADSVVLDQLRILNECFRRTNADTVNLRNDFLSLVGDAKIEFKLAEFDPSGNPSTGITRTYTNITHFGGVLPYNQGQTQLIINWVNDSLFPNYYRITRTNQGGIDPWDNERYLNVWIGDLRILEPQINNFEELVYFGLASPPVNHHNWQNTALDPAQLEQGVLLHYVNLGSNNPNLFPAPYAIFDTLVRSGKMLVHEVGHYLGLRHIWGDGNCTADDFIHDTPKSNAASQYNCNTNKNSCTDTILGLDLPDMIENYMDYSKADCQNSFTEGQVNVMRTVLSNYRTSLPIGVEENTVSDIFNIYPNPTNGDVYFNVLESYREIEASVYTNLGKKVSSNTFYNNEPIHLKIQGTSGIYLLKIKYKNKESFFKVIKY